MGLFRRPQHPAGPPDESLPFFTVDEAARFRTAASASLADLGIEVVMHPDHAVDSAGREFGLWNVATACRAARNERRWAKILAGHFGRVVDNLDGPDPFETLTPEQVRAQTFTRLFPAEAIPDWGQVAHRDFAPGIMEVLALEMPHSVITFSTQNADRFGGWQILSAQGRANLAALGVEHSETVEIDGGSFRAVVGDSMHTASRAVTLPTFAVELGESPPSAYGWLLAVPHRHQMLVHTVNDLSVVSAVNAMAHAAAVGHSDSQGSISPFVYWWDGEQYHQITEFDDEGALTVRVPARLQSVLEEMGLP